MTEPLLLDPTRLAALDAYSILDTLPEEGFDDIAQLAALACNTPVALVSLVDRDRQWFKARVNFPPCETDLDRSVCQFALAEPDLLVIPDLTADPRTSQNPLVTDDPHIRFYAGAPLRTPEGYVLGSLCVIDRNPRPKGLTENQAEHLRRCARQVMNLLAMRRAVAERDEVLAAQDIELRRERRLEVLTDLSFKLLNAVHPAQVLESVLTAEAGKLGIDRSYIYEVIPGEAALRLTHGVGVSDKVRLLLQRMDFGSPVCGLVAQTLEPLILSDVQTGTDPCFQPARDDGVNAYAGYPILSRGQLRGVIAFASSQTRSFDPETLDFFATVSRFISLARERLDSEQALRESDTRSRLAQEAGRVGTFEVNVASSMVKVSPELCRIYGLPETSIYSTDALAACVVDEDRSIAPIETTVCDRTAVVDVEYRIKRANDGALRWIARSGRVARDEAGLVTSMYGTVRDVTGRRQAEAELALSEARYRSLFNAVDSGFCVFEMRFDKVTGQAVDYRFMEVNEAFVAHTGLSDAVGRWMRDLAPGHEQIWFDRYGEIARTGQLQIFEDEAAALGRFYEISAFRVGPPESHQVGALFRDISERRRTELALRDSEALARANVERVQLALEAGAIIGTWHWDLPTDRFTVDDAFARSFGLDPALGREGIPLADIVASVHPEDQASLAEAINEAIRRGGAYAHQYRVRRADGRYYWIEANGRVDYAPDGTPTSFPGVLLDIEERRAADQRRHALLDLGDQLRDLTSVDELTMAACVTLGAVLGAELVGYGDVDPRAETITVARDWTAEGTPTLAGTLNFRDFGSYIEDLKQGRTVVVSDVRTDPRTANFADALEGRSARSFVNTPVFERSQFIALLYVSTAKAREWHEGELTFIREVASRLRSAVARVQAEAQRDLLNQELSHRLKNTLAMVLSIATQTLRAVPDKAPVKAFEKRIHALSTAHDILLREEWASAPLQAVATAVLENFAQGDRLELTGPPISLGPRAALSTSLLLHELATNASKYGSLSSDTGKILVSWQVEGKGNEAELVINWRERGGPVVSEPPAQKGFGSRLIKMGLIGTGNVTLSYLQPGFEAELRAPVSQVQES